MQTLAIIFSILTFNPFYATHQLFKKSDSYAFFFCFVVRVVPSWNEFFYINTF